MPDADTQDSPRPVLLLLDVQNNFFEGKTTIPNAAGVSHMIGQVIDKARRGSRPVTFVWVRNCGETGDPDQVNTKGWEIYVPPSPSSTTPSSTHQSSLPHTDHVVDKNRNNAFDKALLDSYIPPHPPYPLSLYVVGMQSEYDVKYTCYSGLERGYIVYLVKGAHGTFHTEEDRADRIENDVEIELEDAGVRLVDVGSLGF